MHDEGTGIPPLRFTVSQVRVAAACPRLAYFDAEYNRRHQRSHPRVSRLWKRLDDGEIVGLGGMLHHSGERFHRLGRLDNTSLKMR